MKRIGMMTLAACLTGLLAQAADAEKKPGPAAATRKSLIEKYDTNGDGKLDPAEREAARAEIQKQREAERLKKYDKNHDGKLDEAEMKAEQEAVKAEFKKRRAAVVERRPGAEPPKEKKD